MRLSTALATLALAVVAVAGRAQQPAVTLSCAPLASALSEALGRGWTAWRAGDVGGADSLFQTVLAACPAHGGANDGAGYVALRANDLTAAAARFDRALAANPLDYDALTGRGMVAFRAADHAAARALFQMALTVVPGDALSRSYLDRLPSVLDSSALPPRPRPARRVVAARTGPRTFLVPDGRGGWKPIWIKAVNVGAALPGKHPSEFPPDDSTYERWIKLAADMGANALRFYTIHPPHLYRALRRWNMAHPARPMWIIHGVWTELPPGEQEEQYDDSAWTGEFHDEMRRVVDLLHGHALIPARPGHASGVYTADVSPWVLGYIIGREWEPYSVVAYAAAHPGRTSYHGTYLTIDGGNAVESWLAAFCDSLIRYEMGRYNAQRPIAYTNWPTLDPLTHPTESTREEEDSIRRARGQVMPERPREFDNDAIGLDAAKMRATAAYPAGVFASYHAYPYYPDFLVLDPGYLRARSPEGPSAYFGYLRELVEHHRDMPVVISEYGVPSSRGVAHVQPQGWNHGGHSEAAQAAIDARLTRDIRASGAAGAGLFAIIDEWFKKNWIVIDFEQPLERNRLWLNPLDAEQNYGVVAMRPGPADSAIVIDGRGDDWRGRAPWYHNDTLARTPPIPAIRPPPGTDPAAKPAPLPAPLQLRALRVASDEAYVYLRLDVGAIDWARGRYLIGIDTYRADLGDTRFPYTDTASPVGLEFVLDLHGPVGSHLLVDAPYNPYRRVPIAGANPPESQSVYHVPFRTVANSEGRYDSLRVVTNRHRIGRDGTDYPEVGSDRSLLLFARQADNSLADWYADSASGIIEVRIPWGMLNVLDPSSRTVLYSTRDNRDVQGEPTPGFRFVVESYDPVRPSASGDRMPRSQGADVDSGSGEPNAAKSGADSAGRAPGPGKAGVDSAGRKPEPARTGADSGSAAAWASALTILSPKPAFAAPPLWTWPTWEVPRWHAEVKPLFEAMKQTFDAIPDTPLPRQARAGAVRRTTAPAPPASTPGTRPRTPSSAPPRS